MSADLARAIQKEAESDPPLSARQRARLAILLRGKKSAAPESGEKTGRLR
jgi:hypothetical protein